MTRHEIHCRPQCVTLEGLGLPYLKQFIELFPESSLALMFKAYFAYSGTVLGDEDSTEELIMSVAGDPYDIILASGYNYASPDIVYIFLRMLFLLSRTFPWRI